MLEDELTHKTCETAWAKIYIAGNIEIIEQTCREWCMKGACVTVTPTNYIYTMGEEPGAEIGLINYPRFPIDFPQAQITNQAVELGELIMEKACQGSFTIVAPNGTHFISRRKGD